jgi:hypothetical protein
MGSLEQYEGQSFIWTSGLSLEGYHHNLPHCRIIIVLAETTQKNPNTIKVYAIRVNHGEIKREPCLYVVVPLVLSFTYERVMIPAKLKIKLQIVRISCNMVYYNHSKG